MFRLPSTSKISLTCNDVYYYWCGLSIWRDAAVVARIRDRGCSEPKFAETPSVVQDAELLKKIQSGSLVISSKTCKTSESKYQLNNKSGKISLEWSI